MNFKTNKKRLKFAKSQSKKKTMDIEMNDNAQGFGYEWDGEKWVHIKHTGKIKIELNVDIHFGVVICRGTADDNITHIGEGTKIDGLTYIAHNVKIGKHCLIHANVTICGSVEIGDYCIINPGATINRKYKIGSNVEILPNSWVCSNIPDGETWGGWPAKKMKL